MPERLSRKKNRKLSKRYSNKRGGMFRAAKAAKETAIKFANSARRKLNRRSFEEKLLDDITKLINYMPLGLGKKEKELRQKMHLKYILSDEENKFKTMVYDISDRISMLEVTQREKVKFLELFRKNLVKILGNNKPSQRAIYELIQPILKSLNIDVTIEEGMAGLSLSNARKDYNKTMRGLNTRLRRTNRATAAFLDPRMLTTTTTNNGRGEVTQPRATNVNQSEVNNLLAQMKNEVRLNLEQSLPSAPTTKPRAKGGYRKIKKSRKRVYS